MSSAPLKAVYVPRFGSQSSTSSWSQLTTNEYLVELPSSGQSKQHGLGFSTKKVKLTKYTKPKLSTKKLKDYERARPKSPVLEVPRMTAIRQPGATSQSRSQCSRRGDPHTANEDVFTFSQSDSPISNNPMAPRRSSARPRLSVLNTISRMLQENRALRERLLYLTQTSTRQVKLEPH